jgi:PAS domain S-box-containing protein
MQVLGFLFLWGFKMADNTKEELIEEIMLLKKRITELEKLYTETWQKHQNIRRFETVVRDSNDSIIIHNLEGRITAWNRGAEKMYGYSEKEALGMNIERLTPPEKAVEHKELTCHLLAGEIVDSLETKRIAKDGSILDVWMTVSKIIEYPEDSIISTDRDVTKPIGVALIERNITERKKTEEAIKNSQKLLQRIIDLLPIRIFWKDRNLRYLGCNLIFAKDAGKNQPEDLIGKDDFQMAWKDQAKAYQADDQGVIKSGKVKFNYEESQTTPKGDKIWLKTSKVPLIDSRGNEIGILGTYEDITERKQAEEITQKYLHELEVFYKSAMGREERIIELKKEAENLKEKLEK